MCVIQLQKVFFLQHVLRNVTLSINSLNLNLRMHFTNCYRAVTNQTGIFTVSSQCNLLTLNSFLEIVLKINYHYTRLVYINHQKVLRCQEFFKAKLGTHCIYVVSFNQKCQEVRTR